MLMRFSISNFMSFGYKTDETQQIVPEEFYLYAGRSEQHKERIIHFADRKVLKFSSIYGANASGKTNLIKAIDAGRQILLNTMDGTDFEDKYCRSQKCNHDLPSMFEYEFTVGTQCFAYGYTVHLEKKCILSEWLYEMEGEKEHTIFERTADDGKYYFDEDMFSDSRNIQYFHYYMQDSNRVRQSLLLHEINRRNMDDEDFELFSTIYDWFKTKLNIIYPDTRIGASYFLFGDDNNKLVDILSYLDTGITNYKMSEMKESAFKEYFPDDTVAEKYLKNKREDGRRRKRSILNVAGTLFAIKYRDSGAESIKKLMFQHGSAGNGFEYGEESDGTQRLIELLDVLLNDDEEKVFFIDELDRSLHPQMTIKFVETFLKISKNKNTQLIITTHESNLMDLNILRRDEIWFAERENDHTTSLYTLEKFKIRHDKVVAKDYLAGRYGAVPVFKDFEYIWGGNEPWKD